MQNCIEIIEKIIKCFHCGLFRYDAISFKTMRLRIEKSKLVEKIVATITIQISNPVATIFIYFLLIACDFWSMNQLFENAEWFTHRKERFAEMSI